MFPTHAISHRLYAIGSSFSGRGGRLARQDLPNKQPATFLAPFTESSVFQ